MPNPKSKTRNPELPADLAAAARFLHARGFSPRAGTLAVILGSGFGQIEQACKAVARADYAAIPGLPEPSGLPGHVCRLTQGRMWGQNALVFCGRYHAYEGFSARDLALLPRLAHALGACTMVITNAAGGVRKNLTTGALMAICDHINMMGLNPLAGRHRLPGAARFAPMAGVYDAALLRTMLAAGKAAGEKLRMGVYAGVLGPSFETAAEVRMLRALGADAVGMSTVPEAIVAHALGMRVCGLSLITNRAGSSDDSHEKTLRRATRSAARIADVLSLFFRGL